VIVVAEDDADVARAIEINLALEGYVVHVCPQGDDVLSTVHRVRPDLVLLDVVLPGADGLEVCKALRADQRIADVAVLMISARAAQPDRLAGFEAGANDYIVKPFDPAELLARVRAALERTQRMRDVSPLTGLPGTFRIEAELDRRCADPHADFAVVHVDLNWFKSYNDRYGWLRGNEVLSFTADVLARALADHDPEGFLGHVGGDDFVVVCDAGVVEELCRHATGAFDAGIGSFYEADDAARGYVEGVDRKGNVHRFPLVGMALGVATTRSRPLRTRWEASEVAGEMKAHAKRHGTSAYEIDRRRA
jgi:PleD family two-component response regulator